MSRTDRIATAEESATPPQDSAAAKPEPADRPSAPPSRRKATRRATPPQGAATEPAVPPEGAGTEPAGSTTRTTSRVQPPTAKGTTAKPPTAKGTTAKAPTAKATKRDKTRPVRTELVSLVKVREAAPVSLVKRPKSAESPKPPSLLDGELQLPTWFTSDAGPRGPLHKVAAAALAAASGTGLVAAFPPYGLWWLAPLAVAALVIATRGQRLWFGLVLGALHGAAFFAPLLHWTGIYVGPLPWLLLSGLQTLFACALGGAAAVTSRLPGWTLPPVTAALWVGQEALRARIPFGGFPWGRLAFSQDESPLLHLARFGGAPLVTFAVALAGGLLAAIVAWPRGYPPSRHGVRAGLLVGAAGLIVLGGLLTPLPTADGKTLTVAVIQGNVPRLGLDFNAQRRAVLDNHVKATRQLAEQVAAGTARQPALVVWPENSSDIDPLVNNDANALIQEAADRIAAPILVGAVLDGPGRFVSNAGIVWQPRTGPSARYLKRHPVPFAEYMPMRELARKVTDKVDLVRRDFAGGDKIGTLRMGPATVGDVICFEVAYDDLVRDTVNHGAGLLVVQTNNATFGRSAESAQQLAMVRLRAIEHGRPAVMASTSGASATIDARGRVLDRSGLFTAAVFVRDLRLGESRTLATMLGGWPEASIALLAVAAIVAAFAGIVAGRLPRRRRPTAAAPAPSPKEDA